MADWCFVIEEPIRGHVLSRVCQFTHYRE